VGSEQLPVVQTNHPTAADYHQRLQHIQPFVYLLRFCRQQAA